MIKLIYGANNPDIHYASGRSFLDPVFLIDDGNIKHLYLYSLELDAVESRPSLNIIPLEPLIEKARANPDHTPFRNKLALALLQSHKKVINVLHVSPDFPVEIADYLRLKGFTLVLVSSLYPEREVKTPKEIKMIQNVINRTELAFELFESILKESAIKGSRIIYRGSPLTVEFLKHELTHFFADNNLAAPEIILSSGPHTAIPHHLGEGSLKPYIPIILDLFPRDSHTGYFADMARTYVKGRPSPQVASMYQSVLDAQSASIALIREGVSAKAVHDASLALFDSKGFKTTGKEGLIHALGHGVGLHIHENPRLGSLDIPLQAGNVLAIEPGLYYMKHGGIRIEDMVLVGKSSSKFLSHHPKAFIIP